MGSELGSEKWEVGKKSVRTYKDLDVYQRSLEAAKTVLTCVVPRLPAVEKFDLADQLRRCCKAIPALIAEGYAKKHQPRAFQNLVICRDVYNIDKDLCDRLIDTYEIAGKQLYNLRRNWTSYGKEKL